ncbi:hypothetical protein LAZ67_1005011 [Cordylochernes scorpioides]|uniref:Mos1 transposase HTH domain-containing protein n=1 Tax=Cordylochernes scorpioides TaxID=51811 RepID=A0ABY6JXX1_9ARAC|nr:hypothetical protein LAZ67_1005011 [Cordylochernes scorpioides]
MEQKLKQRICIEFCVKFQISATETFEMLNKAFPNDAPKRTTVFEWHSRFKAGRISNEDDPQNPRTTLLELEQDTGISKTTIGRIVTEDLKLKKTPAKFIPRFLTNEQKLCRLATCEDMMEMTRTDPEWKDKIITGDETWVYGYDPETKPQSAEWGGKRFEKKRPEKWTNGGWILHHDNARPHTAHLMTSLLAKNGTQILLQPPYFSDIAPNDFFLFPKLKAVLKGRHFDTRDDIIEKSPCNPTVLEVRRRRKKEMGVPPLLAGRYHSTTPSGDFTWTYITGHHQSDVRNFVTSWSHLSVSNCTSDHNGTSPLPVQSPDEKGGGASIKVSFFCHQKYFRTLRLCLSVRNCTSDHHGRSFLPSRWPKATNVATFCLIYSPGMLEVLLEPLPQRVGHLVEADELLDPEQLRVVPGRAGVQPLDDGRYVPEYTGVHQGWTVKSDDIAARYLNLPSGYKSIIREISTKFTCRGRADGYHADVENECKIFHLCEGERDPEGEILYSKRYSFLCPKGTIFDQTLQKQPSSCLKLYGRYQIFFSISQAPSTEALSITETESSTTEALETTSCHLIQSAISENEIDSIATNRGWTEGLKSLRALCPLLKPAESESVKPNKSEQASQPDIGANPQHSSESCSGSPSNNKTSESAEEPQKIDENAKEELLKRLIPTWRNQALKPLFPSEIMMILSSLTFLLFARFLAKIQLEDKKTRKSLILRSHRGVIWPSLIELLGMNSTKKPENSSSPAPSSEESQRSDLSSIMDLLGLNSSKKPENSSSPAPSSEEPQRSDLSGFTGSSKPSFYRSSSNFN